MKRIPSPHLAGRPVSRTTYDSHGCRCDGCHAAKSGKNPNRNAKRSLARADAREVVPPIPRGIRDEARRQAVECLIARGYEASRIMAKLDISYEFVWSVRDNMDRMAA